MGRRNATLVLQMDLMEVAVPNAVVLFAAVVFVQSRPINALPTHAVMAVENAVRHKSLKMRLANSLQALPGIAIPMRYAQPKSFRNR